MLRTIHFMATTRFRPGSTKRGPRTCVVDQVRPGSAPPHQPAFLHAPESTGGALPVVALRRRPGGAVHPRPPYGCAGLVGAYRREAQRGHRVVRCALLGPPPEPV